MNPDSLTEVFNGEVSIKNVDKSDVLFEFDEPYPYHGGNLVVYVYMDDTKFHGRMTQFYGTSEPGVYHTLMKYTSTADLDPEAPAGTGDLTYYFESRPNTTFLMDMSGTGSLQGKVTDAAGSPLAGAFLRVPGSQLSDSADREGRYSFDYLAAGETSLEVEKFGYRNRTGSVEVKAMQENTLDLVMEAYDQYALSGKVTSLAMPGGLPGVIVRVEGYGSYSDTTAGDGTYEIEGIYDEHEYSVSFELAGYATVDTLLAFAGSDRVCDIMLEERPLPVNRLAVSIQGEGAAEKAVVSWHRPALPQLFRYDNGLYAGSLGYSDGDYNGVFGSVHRVPAQLERMEWFLGDLGGKQERVNLFVFDLDASGMPTNQILYTALVETDTMKWCSHEFPVPVECPNGFFVAVSVAGNGSVSIGLSLADEEYPVVSETQFFGDYTVGFSELSSLSGYEEAIFMIRAEGTAFGTEAKFGPAKSVPAEDARSIRDLASTRGGERSTLLGQPGVSVTSGTSGLEGKWAEQAVDSWKGVPVRDAKATGDPAPEHYVLYRLEQHDAEEDWTLVSDALEDTVHVDAGWAGLEEGKAYQYAVKAAYTGENLSKPVLSAVVWKGMEVAYEVRVTTNNGQSADSAVVNLTGTDAASDHSYTALVQDGTALFPAVWKGTYSLSVQKSGFEPYELSDLLIEEAGSTQVELKELIQAPYNLKVEVEGSTAVLTWNNVPETFFDDMESYEDFIIEDIGEYTMADLDGGPTYFWNNVQAPNKNYTGSFMVVNPLATNPPQSQSDAAPYSGEKYLACFDNNSGANDDWLILPAVKVTEGSVFSFHAKSLNIEYGYERFSVWVSTSGQSAPDDFQKISEGDYVEAADVWTPYEYDLSAYEGSVVYLAIRCVSDNSFAFMVDDISVGASAKLAQAQKSLESFNVFLDDVEVASGLTDTRYVFTGLRVDAKYTAGVQAVYTTGLSEITTLVFSTGSESNEGMEEMVLRLWPNPVTDVLHLSSGHPVEKLELRDLQGRLMGIWEGNTEVLPMASLPSGTYVLRVCMEGRWVSAKVVKM